MRRSVLGLTLALTAIAIAPTAAQAVTVQQWNTPAPQLIPKSTLFPRDLVNGKLVTNVVLPTGYNSRKCWPVMYLLHGTADSTAPVSLQWLQIGDGQLLKMNIPAILVVPGSGDSWWDNNWWNGYRHPAFESWVLQDIVPLVAHRLHVCTGRNEHAIAGLSMGGYGAIYLASQLPGYFGSAGSFSGVLSPESPNFLTIYPQFPTYWGPADKFYAVGHDPMALVDNLRNTRVFVGVGNGVPTADETTVLVSQFEEAEFHQEDIAWVAKARAAHVAVKFDQHPGTHTFQNWLLSLGNMLKWKPFAPVVTIPSSWTYTTVATTGTAWNYQFAFSRYAPPTQLIQFSMSRGVFSARGGGVVTITTPAGKKLSGKIPFQIRNGKVVETPRATKPRVVGGYQKLMPVKINVTPPSTGTGAATISFTTVEALPKNDEYQVGLGTISTTGPACSDTVFKRVYQPAKGQVVTATISPPANATTPNNWCSGPAYVAVSEVPKSAPPEFGNFLAYTGVTLP